MEMLFSYVTSLKEILVGKKLSRLKSMLHCSPETHTSQKKRTRGLTMLFRYLIYMAT